MGLLIGSLVIVLVMGVSGCSGSDSHPVTGASQQTDPSSLPPSPSSGLKIPSDATKLLGESQARTIAGVAKLHWVSSGGTEDRSGRLNSDTRYANSNYAYPDRALRYIEVAIYKGHNEYVNMRDQSFDASTGERDWSFVGAQDHPQLTGATEAFVSNRYARDGSVVRMLGFTFRDVSMKIEVCNLSTTTLFATAQVVIGKLNELYATRSV